MSDFSRLRVAGKDFAYLLIVLILGLAISAYVLDSLQGTSPVANGTLDEVVTTFKSKYGTLTNISATAAIAAGVAIIIIAFLIALRVMEGT